MLKVRPALRVSPAEPEPELRFKLGPGPGLGLVRVVSGQGLWLLSRYLVAWRIKAANSGIASKPKTARSVCLAC